MPYNPVNSVNPVNPVKKRVKYFIFRMKDAKVNL